MDKTTMNKNMSPVLATQLIPNQFITIMMISVNTENNLICKASGPNVNPEAIFNVSTAPIMYIDPDKVVAK